MSVLGAAIMLAQRGYAMHWVRQRDKAPIAEGWSTAPVATVTDLRQTYRPGYNIGVRCGHWSCPLPEHGLVIIDVDIRSPEATGPALAAVETLLGDMPAAPMGLSGGGNGGRHLWFACPIDTLRPKANVTILAAERWKLEVLSTGKQVVVPPSMHPSGQPYRWLTPLTTLPLLPAAIHDAIEAALSAGMQTAIATGRIVQGLPAGPGARPGDDFNHRADWGSILRPHGWVPVRQRGGVTHWRRPDKGEGISATTNYAGSGLLYIFSTNAAPFEADTVYTPFAAYAITFKGIANFERSPPCGVGEDKQRIKAPYFACWCIRARAGPVNGTARRSPFFVSWKVNVPRFRSTSGQRNPSSSPRLAPVARARTTIVCR